MCVPKGGIKLTSMHDQPSSQSGGTGTTSSTSGAQYKPRPSEQYEDSAAYTGPRHAGAAWGGTALAGTLMMLGGLWGFFAGMVAVVKGSFFVTTANYTLNWSISAWGWTTLALGVVVFAAGACVLLDMTWARVVGVILAVFYGIEAFMFLPHYPLWAIILIAINVFIIWALLTPRYELR